MLGFNVHTHSLPKLCHHVKAIQLRILGHDTPSSKGPLIEQTSPGGGGAGLNSFSEAIIWHTASNASTAWLAGQKQAGGPYKPKQDGSAGRHRQKACHENEVVENAKEHNEKEFIGGWVMECILLLIPSAECGGKLAGSIGQGWDPKTDAAEKVCLRWAGVP